MLAPIWPVQGTITQTDNPLGLAIAGQGFFAVSQQSGEVNNIPTFDQQQFYSRAGDFQMDKNGFLVNSAGDYLNGWPVDAAGVVNQNTLAPIQVTQTVYNPVPTTNVTLSANLPATPATGTAVAGTPISSDIDVYDSLGTMHTVTLNWVKTAQDTWSVQVNSPDDTTAPNRGVADVDFGPTTSNNPVPSGTVGALGVDAADPGNGLAVSPYAANTAATVSFTANFPAGPQTITLNLGTYGQTNGVTQYAGTQYNLRGLTQSGVPPGAFSPAATSSSTTTTASHAPSRRCR
jgi:flagellar hook protein FlgE